MHHNTNKLLMKTILRLGLVLLMASLPTEQLYANDPPGQIAVSPAMVEMKIGSKPVSQSIRLKNLKKEAVTLKAEVFNWTLDNQNKLKMMPPDGQSLDQWMIINPEIFTIEPGKEQVIRFSVRPRTTPLPGEHRAIIYFTEQSPAMSPEGVEILFKLGVGVYGYADNVRHTSALEGITFDSASKTLKVDILNSGNVHTRLKGDYAIWKKGTFPGFNAINTYLNWPHNKTKPDWFIGAGSMDNTPVLPGTRRTISTRIPLPADKNGYVVTVTGTIDDTKVEKVFSVN